jgi:2-polyprenyl-3-methyl-5-hydroxy-6-metoxy-1,4-benzoquinol methylase
MYLLPALFRILKKEFPAGAARRIFDLGCGNGSVAQELHQNGFEIVGVDPSLEGIAVAQKTYPHLKLENGSSEDDLAALYGRFPCVLSLEVIEHVYSPRQFARRVYDLLESGGLAVISTPYHAYLKNLGLAVAGRLDAHFNSLQENGHIKFWSMKTLARLLSETGFRDIRFMRVGRIPPLAKSMIAIARKSLQRDI